MYVYIYIRIYIYVYTYVFILCLGLCVWQLFSTKKKNHTYVSLWGITPNETKRVITKKGLHT